MQEAVPVLDGDTAATLHGRIQDAERRVYVEAVRRVMGGTMRLQGRRAVFG